GLFNFNNSLICFSLKPISSNEFKSLLTQLNNKEQEISHLKDKINASTKNFVLSLI
ncbi:505_t:CDS:1, partial [Gigaspora margarita]